MNPSVLVVEDEEEIRELLVYTLRQEGYAVTAVASGEEALAALAAPAQPGRPGRPALVLLDLMLPGLDGLAVCRRLRQSAKPTEMAIVMLTARGEEDDVVAGLNAGANDYIVKPFRRNVLLARVRAALRNTGLAHRAVEPSDDEPPLAVRNIAIDVHRHRVTVAGRPVELSATEFRLLVALARRPGWVLTREQILEAARGDEHAATARAVDVQIVGLRKKLGAAGRLVETVRGVGYRLKE